MFEFPLQSDPESGSPRAADFIRGGAIALLGFLVTAAVIHLCLGNPLRLYAADRNEQFDIADHSSGKAFSAAFGSSHMHNGFDPRVFDRVLAGTPLETRTLNLAINGGSQVEQRATALEFLHDLRAPQAGPDTCFTLLELSAGANIGSGYFVHPRTINLYDWHSVRFVYELSGSGLNERRSLGRVAFATAAAGMYYTNIGMVSNKIFTPPLNQQLLDDELAQDRRGADLMQTDVRSVPGLRAIIQRAPKAPTMHPGEFLPGNAELADELEAASPVHPLNIVYVEMPMLSDLVSTTAYPAELKTATMTVPVISLNRPDLYPQLYRLEYWHDDAHLNQAGAELASSLIATNLKAWYAQRGWPSRCEAR